MMLWRVGIVGAALNAQRRMAWLHRVQCVAGWCPAIQSRRLGSARTDMRDARRGRANLGIGENRVEQMATDPTKSFAGNSSPSHRAFTTLQVPQTSTQCFRSVLLCALGAKTTKGWR